MSRYHGNGEECPHCGLTYGRFRTGMSYQDVYYLIWDRPHKRRRGVLGAWYQIKRRMWREHTRTCGQVCHFPDLVVDPADFTD